MCACVHVCMCACHFNISVIYCHALTVTALLLNGVLFVFVLDMQFRHGNLLHISGGDYSTQKYDAEIHANNGTIGVYRSDVGGGSGYKLLYALTGTVKKTMLIRVGKMELYMTNYDGSNLYTNDKSLFNLSKMYMGLNRVIYRYKSASVSHGRVGTGLCSVCIDFSSTAIESVHKTY